MFGGWWVEGHCGLYGGTGVRPAGELRGEHNNRVVIGNNQESDKPNQLKIGNNDISVSRDITDEEFQEILATFKSVRELLPSKQLGPTGFGYDTLFNFK